MIYIKTILAGLLCAALLTCFGCVSSKKLNKKSTESDTTFIDKTQEKTEITEKVDTVVYTRVDTTKFSIPTTDTATVIMDTPTSRIEAKYNKKTKHVDVVLIDKAKPVHVYVDRKINTVKKVDIKASGHKKEKSKDLDKKTFSLPWWLWLVLGIILLLYLFYRFYLKKQFPFLP